MCVYVCAVHPGTQMHQHLTKEERLCTVPLHTESALPVLLSFLPNTALVFNVVVLEFVLHLCKIVFSFHGY